MNNTAEDVLREIEAIVWDPTTSDLEKTHAVQGLLYAWDQICDGRMTRWAWEQHGSVLTSESV